MPNINSWGAFSFVAGDGSTVEGGSLDVPSILSSQANALVYQNSLSLAQGSSGTLWDAANGPSDFTFAFITSDTGDGTNGWVVLELTTDENNTYGTKYATLALAAGIPLPLGSSASYANYSAGFAGGTLSKIQKLKVKNLNTAQANIKIVLVY